MTETKRPQKGRIFISYRRVDTSYAAGRFYDRLVAKFGEDAIFMDVDTIEGGLDFVKVLEDAVQSCDVLIALIGKQWLSAKDKDGNRRLDNPEDFVLIEVATALKRNIRVIPVLVDGVEMPRSTELPDNLKALARRNALQVNHHSFNPDVYRLIEHTKSALDEAEESRVMKAHALQVAREKAAKEKADREAADKTRLEAEGEIIDVDEDVLDKLPPPLDDMAPPPDNFPDGWGDEWQPGFETETTKTSGNDGSDEPRKQGELERALKNIDKDHKHRVQKIEREYRWNTFVGAIRYRLKLINIYRIPILILVVGLAIVVPLVIDLS